MSILKDEELLKKVLKKLKESKSNDSAYALLAEEKGLDDIQIAKMKKQAEQYTYLFTRIFSEGNMRIRGNYIQLKDENGKFTKQVELSRAYKHLEDFFESRKTVDFSFNQSENTQLSNFIVTTTLAQIAIRLYEQPTEEYQKFKNNVNSSINRLKAIAGEEKVFLAAAVIFSDPELKKILKQDFCIEDLTEEDFLQVCQNFLGEEAFKKFWKEYGGVLVEKRNIIKKLETLGYITSEMYRDHKWSKNIIEDYITAKQDGKEKSYLLRYVKSQDLFEAYLNGSIKAKDLEKYTNLEDLLFSNIDKKDIIKILKNVKFNKSASLIIWEQFEKGFWNVDEIRELANLNYIKLTSIINKYREEQSRKILKELKVKPTISEEKLLELFTANFVLAQELLPELPNEFKSFITDELSQTYAKKERDLQSEIVKCVEGRNEEDTDNKDKTLIDLYQKGYITADKLKDSKISENILIKYYYAHGSDKQIFIDFYNNGLLTNDTVLEMFGENTDVLFDMIKSGLNISAIQSWYATSELLEHYNKGLITIQNLIDLKSDIDFSQIAQKDLKLICEMIRTGLDSTELKGVLPTATLLNLLFTEEITKKDLIKLKEDIDIEELKKLYLSEKVSYSQLYGLAKDGIIKIEDADSINEDFDLMESLNKLMDKGLQGSIVQQVPANGKTTRVRKPNQNQTRVPQGLDPKLKDELLLALGSNGIEISTVDCPVFSGYKLIPLMSKKVCILEGEGRTCVMPLKIVFEQLQDPAQRQNDILGTATCRNDVYSNKEYVTSLNHSKKWGKNLVKAVVKRSSKLTSGDTKKIMEEVNQININGKQLLDALQDSYIDRKKDASRF